MHFSRETIMKLLRLFVFSSLVLLTACVGVNQLTYDPVDAMEKVYIEQNKHTSQDFITHLYQSRSWQHPDYLQHDPIALSHASETPVNNAYTKIIGASFDEAVNSLAAKIWLIDNAEHTLDLTYYIYKYDLAGQAILGALCNAVKRGVDIRIMVDSLGSLNLSHNPIRALETCAQDAGYMKTENGDITPHQARVQFVVINALTSAKSWSNRRSHDKLFIKDGNFLGKDFTITGGRNISVDYYGIDNQGQFNPNTYLDLEVLLRSKDRSNNIDNPVSIGEISSLYYSLLFLHDGNRRVKPILDQYDDYEVEIAEQGVEYYNTYLIAAQKALATVMASSSIKQAYRNMDDYVQTDFSPARVRLAHQLENFKTTDVVATAAQTKTQNANSIEGILKAAIEAVQTDLDKNTQSTLRIVSPYIFSPQYKNNKGEVIYDGAKALHNFLAEFPNINIELITNSILTSDNFFTQSVIDMDTAPRLLLSDKQREIWLTGMEESELNPDFTESKQWLEAVNNPRIKIYQTGLADSTILGGDKEYGKLHAKFFFSNAFGFVGTSNFDYRSRLYNNEMGYYFYDEKVSEQLLKSYDQLKSISLRWGSPEWLAMRQAVFTKDTVKTRTSRSQRTRFKIMKNSGLIWLF